MLRYGAAVKRDDTPFTFCLWIVLALALPVNLPYEYKDKKNGMSTRISAQLSSIKASRLR